MAYKFEVWHLIILALAVFVIIKIAPGNNIESITGNPSIDYIRTYCNSDTTGKIYKSTIPDPTLGYLYCISDAPYWDQACNVGGYTYAYVEDCTAYVGNFVCTDSDKGLNYTVQGTTKSTQDNVTHTDTCTATTQLTEYYCGSTGYLGIMQYGCANCINGACVTCNTAADTGCDGHVSLAELSAYTSLWKQGSVTLSQLAAATSVWKRG